MKSFDTLIFDLDGTLTDSAPGIIASARYALSAMGIDEPENMVSFVGPPLYVSFSELCGLNEPQTEEAIRLYRLRYSDKGLFENNVYPGIPEMLEELKSSGRKMLVATSKSEVFAKRILDKFELSRYFDFIGGAALDGSRDDKSDVIEYVLGQNEITDRSSVLMIGDRMHDIVGAEKCGISCIGVLWGYGSREELSSADFTASSPSEAADMLLGR